MLGLSKSGSGPAGAPWQTLYQQCRCFLDGGRTVLLRTVEDPSWWPRQGGSRALLLDLATGRTEEPFPPGWNAIEADDAAGTVLLVRWDTAETALWERRTGRFLYSAAPEPGWEYGGATILADGRRVLAAHFQGRPYRERVRSRIRLLAPGEPVRTVIASDEHYCNHVQGDPIHPDRFCYDRWNTPARDTDQVMHVATLDGAFHAPAKLDDRALRPKSMFGCRDHYLWTPDGRRLVSYLNPDPFEGGVPYRVGHKLEMGAGFNHFQFSWVLSALDWRTGEDLAAPYPPGRWGCHPAVSPDSRFVVSAGGPGFDRLYAVEIEGLRKGWNERVICAYPRTVSKGENHEPFAFPFFLPDGSGILFNAGWPGPDHGLYLAEWKPDRQETPPRK